MSPFSENCPEDLDSAEISLLLAAIKRLPSTLPTLAEWMELGCICAMRTNKPTYKWTLGNWDNGYVPAVNKALENALGARDHPDWSLYIRGEALSSIVKELVKYRRAALQIEEPVELLDVWVHDLLAEVRSLWVSQSRLKYFCIGSTISL